MSVVYMLLNVVDLKCSAGVHVALPAAANVAAACWRPVRCYVQLVQHTECGADSPIKSAGRSTAWCCHHAPCSGSGIASHTTAATSNSSPHLLRS